MAKKPEGGDFVSVFSGQIAEADLIKFVLEEVGIRSWLENEAMGTTLPGVIAPAGNAVRVLVASQDAERARAEIQRAREDETAGE